MARISGTLTDDSGGVVVRRATVQAKRRETDNIRSTSYRLRRALCHCGSADRLLRCSGFETQVLTPSFRLCDRGYRGRRSGRRFCLENRRGTPKMWS